MSSDSRIAKKTATSTDKNRSRSKGKRWGKAAAGEADKAAGRTAERGKARVRVHCLLCKKTGHRVADCRAAKKIDKDLSDDRRVVSGRARRRQAKRQREDEASSDGGEKKARSAGLAGLCFNCGSTAHSRQHCDQPLTADGASFAICYICKGTGHLSSKCPENDHGLYPRGGGCRVCGDKFHYVTDCPIKKQRQLEAEKRAPSKFVASLSSDAGTFEPQVVDAPVEAADGKKKRKKKKTQPADEAQPAEDKPQPATVRKLKPTRRVVAF